MGLLWRKKKPTKEKMHYIIYEYFPCCFFFWVAFFLFNESNKELFPKGKKSMSYKINSLKKYFIFVLCQWENFCCGIINFFWVIHGFGIFVWCIIWFLWVSMASKGFFYVQWLSKRLEKNSKFKILSNQPNRITRLCVRSLKIINEKVSDHQI